MSTKTESAPSASTHANYILVGAAVLLCVSIFASLLCGASVYSPRAVFQDPDAASIVLNLRLPRTICAVLVGASLSVVGVTYQALFKNYLASPFTLGVSSGAALAASAALLLGLSAGRYSLDVGVFALLGALVSIFLITTVHKMHRRADGGSLLLIGIVFSFFCSSVMTLLQYLADYSQLFQVTRWMMGGIPTATWSDLMLGIICFVVTMVWTLRNARGFDLVLFGDDFASVKGVDVTRLMRTTFVCTSIVVGWVVAQCGVIGFVGIIVPAVARLLGGIGHRRLLVLSAVLGGFLVVLCDVAGRLIISPFEIPAGVFTAVIGGPAFVVLILSSGRKSSL